MTDPRHRDSAPTSPAADSRAASARTIDPAPHDRTSNPGEGQFRTRGLAKRILKWAAFIIGLLFFLGVLREAMDPFGDKPYIEISHGDHVHYVPEDRDPNVSIGRFPRTEPAADERITPDGRIVKKD